MIRINCQWIGRSMCCHHPKQRQTFFGLFRRQCVLLNEPEFSQQPSCSLQEPWPRPKGPPPPPPRRSRA